MTSSLLFKILHHVLYRLAGNISYRAQAHWVHFFLFLGNVILELSVPCSNQNWRSLGLRQGVTLGPQRHSALWGPLFLPSRVFFFLGFHLRLQEHMPQNLLEYGYIETNILKSCISETSFILPSCLTESFPGLAPSFRLILIFLQNCEEFVSFSSDFQ